MISRASFGMNDYMGADVASYPARWKPAAGTPAEAAAFARTVVAGCGPLGRDRAKNLLWAAASCLLRHRARAGPGAERAAAPVGDRAVHRARAGPVRRRRGGRCARTCGSSPAQVVPHLDPADAPLPRGRARKPYTARRSPASWRWPAPSPRRRGGRGRPALVCLGAGAGLIRSDLRNVRGTDIAARSGGVIVTVRGGRAPRAVPVLARYHAPLLEAAAFAGDSFLTGGAEPERGNITSPLTRSLAGGTGCRPGHLPAARHLARRVAQLLGLPVFMHAAGITCSQRLGDIIAGLDRAGDEEHAVTLLGGKAR